jgi:hypothetical protein
MTEATNSIVRFATLAINTPDYGSTEESSTSLLDDDEESATPSSYSFDSLKKISRSNIWTSMRVAQSFNVHEGECALVPTQRKDNVKVVVDSNLNPFENGALYYSSDCFYNKDEDPMYILTIHTDLYARVISEVNDAVSTPFGLYFCCHGGDGAHSGVSHDGHVDIRLAWVLVGLVLSAMMAFDVLEI